MSKPHAEDVGAALQLHDADWIALSQLLIASINPVSIYKIENRYAGSGGEMRSVNLIVLLPNTDTKPMREYEPILQLKRLAASSIECSFHWAHTAAAWMIKGHTLFCRYLIPQNLIYDEGTLTLPEPDAAVVESMSEHIAEQFSIFFGKAESFYRCALLMLLECPEHPPALTLFMLHQAAKLGYRSILES